MINLSILSSNKSDVIVEVFLKLILSIKMSDENNGVNSLSNNTGPESLADDKRNDKQKSNL